MNAESSMAAIGRVRLGSSPPAGYVPHRLWQPQLPGYSVASGQTRLWRLHHYRTGAGTRRNTGSILDDLSASRAFLRRVGF